LLLIPNSILHRTRPVDITVQNRYLEQVVIVTGNLSASSFEDSSRSTKNLASEASLTQMCYAQECSRSVF
jgi:hypothetical protein